VSISEPFIRRPVATTLLMFGLLLAGMTGYAQLPVAALPAGMETTISGGCHGVVTVVPTRTVVCGWPLMAVQVAPAVAALVPVPQTQPHIGTVLPSGSVVVCRVAVRFTT